MFSALAIAFALSAQRAHAGALADAFCRAMSANDVRAFAPLTNQFDLGSVAWRSLREDLVWKYDCIQLSGYTWQIDERSGTVIVDIDASGITRNAKRERRTIPHLWYLRLGPDGQTIASVEDEATAFAHHLLQSPSEATPSAIADEPSLLSSVARVVSVEIRNHPPIEVRNTASLLLDWSISHNDSLTETYATLVLAELEELEGNHSRATRLFQYARMAARHAGSCDAAAYADLLSGNYATDAGEKAALFQSASASIESLDVPSPAFVALYHQSGLRAEDIDIGGSYQILDRMEALARHYGNLEGEVRAAYGKTTITKMVNDDEVALRLGLQTSALANEMGTGEAAVWTQIGLTYNDLGNHVRSAEAFEHALSLMPPDTMGVGAYAHAWLGYELLKLGRVSEAATHLEPALRLGPDKASYRLQALWFGENLRHFQGRYAEAIDFARQAIDMHRGSLAMIWMVKSDLGEMLSECGKGEQGVDELRQSIALIEARRALTTSNPIIRARHLAIRAEVYNRLVSALFSQRRIEEAFVVAEQIKARALEDSLAGRRERLPLTPSEQAKEQTLNQNLVDANRAFLAASAKDENAAAEANLLSARADLETFTAATVLRYSRTIPAPPPIDVEEIVTRHPQSVIIEYSVVPNAILAFVVREGKITGRIIENRQHAEQLALDLAQRIDRRDVEYSVTARALYDVLFAPIDDLLPKGGSLTIVPDGFLWNIPFHALLTQANQYVVERYAISYAPSLTMLDLAQSRVRETAPKELLALGDPRVSTKAKQVGPVLRGVTLGPLRDAREEVRALADIYGVTNSTILIDRNASETELKRLIGDYRVVHLAAHGVVDDEAPLYSAVVLAASEADRDNDGMFEMREIPDLHLRADLVILSACNTARGEVYPGEGMIGLSWAFLTAGSTATVVSMWRTDSKATKSLMIAFHRALRAGKRAPEALRAAEMQLMNDSRHEHPMYWAPFIVVGAGQSDTHEH